MKFKNRTINISAPGKIVLCGEHAVLRKYPAISLAINQRMFVKISQIDKNEVVINSKFGRIVLSNLQSMHNNNANSKESIPSWCKTIYFLLTKIAHRGLVIDVNSNIDDYGFGSSGATFSCICCGLLLLNNNNLTKQRLLQKTLELYFEYHDNATFKPSGIDIATSISGGIIYYFPSKQIVENLPIELINEYRFFAIYTGHKTNTFDAKNIADKVSNCNEIYKEIGKIVDNIYAYLKNNKRLKQLTFLDYLQKNQLLLEKLNLCDNDINNIMQQCKKQNICAKISGSGLGDCVIAICEKNKDFKIENYKKIELIIDCEGIKYEFD